MSTASEPEEQRLRGRQLLAEALNDPSLQYLKVADRAGRSQSLIQWLDSKIDGLAAVTITRTRLAGGCLDMASEHHKAIVTLIASRLHGSALALIGPMLESYHRGAWLHQCASEKDLNNFSSGALDLRISSAIGDLEKLKSFKCDALLKVKEAGWKKMCDFTHTSAQQSIRRNKTESIEPNYDDEELLEALGFADAVGAMCGLEIAHLANDVALANEIFETIKSRFS